MTNAIVFVQIQGRPEVREVELSLPATGEDIFALLKKLDVEVGADTPVFIDETEDALGGDQKSPIEGIKSGSRIHVTRCKRIKVKVHYLNKTIDRAFAPGVRLRRVKQWAVRELNINPTDAGEHVLQLCNTTTQPPTDTPLAELVAGRDCDLCFDLVPEKRVEG
jgi:hypothetical protein